MGYRQTSFKNDCILKTQFCYLFVFACVDQLNLMVLMAFNKTATNVRRTEAEVWNKIRLFLSYTFLITVEIYVGQFGLFTLFVTPRCL